MTAHNAAMARWSEALQKEAAALWQRAAILRARRFDLPSEWEISLADAMRNHAAGLACSVTFASQLRRAAALLPNVRPYGAGGAS